MKITRFEDIESWKKARTLTSEIYKITATGEFVRDFGLKDQIRRASVSILSNIAEGFERGGDKEFLHFLAIAKRLLRRSSGATLRRFGSTLPFAGSLRSVIDQRN